MNSDVWADRMACPRIWVLTSVGLSVAPLVATSVVGAAAQSFDPGDESCTDKPEGTTCWMELVNHSECYLWNPGLALGAAATWSGDCDDGLANGLGTITWTFEGDKVQFEMGMLRGGQRNGRWASVRADDSSGEALYYFAGSYVDGQRYGRWVFRFPDGQIEEGPYERGQQHGQWNIRFADGDTGEGPYVNGEKHGRWVYRSDDGSSCSVQFLNGEQQGECKQDGRPEVAARFVATDDDGGTIINPMIVVGLIHCGVTHGLGPALYEEIPYDEDGNNLPGSFMDHLETSAWETGRTVTPLPHHLLGATGVGETATVVAPPTIANVVVDATGAPGGDSYGYSDSAGSGVGGEGGLALSESGSRSPFLRSGSSVRLPATSQLTGETQVAAATDRPRSRLNRPSSHSPRFQASILGPYQDPCLAPIL